MINRRLGNTCVHAPVANGSNPVSAWDGTQKGKNALDRVIGYRPLPRGHPERREHLLWERLLRRELGYSGKQVLV